MKIERETIVKIELSESEAGDLRAILKAMAKLSCPLDMR